MKALYSSYVRRLRDTEGKKVQAVLSDYATAAHEGVISVKNGVVLSDGTTVDHIHAVAWVAGATAAAAVNESLTYQGYGRVLRVLDGIANDMKRIFENYYIGKVANNEEGRALFWSQCASYMNDLQDIGAIDFRLGGLYGCCDWYADRREVLCVYIIKKGVDE